MNVCVTGAAGFIGSHLCERLRARGDRVVGLDNFDPFYPRAVKERNLAALGRDPGFSLVEGDVRDASSVKRALAAAAPLDAVVHMAALAGVRPSIEQSLRCHEVNVLGTVTLLEACRAQGVRRCLFGSSSSVYGEGSMPPFRESEPCGRPLSPYAASKRAGELVAFTEHKLHGTALTCLRFFTVYGPRQRPDLAIHKFTNLIAAGQPVPLFGDGSSSRDYTFIDDILDGVVAALDRQAQGPPRFLVYNLGGSRATTLRELVDRIASALGREPVVELEPEQRGDMPHTLADVTLAGRDLGYAPKVTIADGLSRFLAWWREQNTSP